MWKAPLGPLPLAWRVVGAGWELAHGPCPLPGVSTPKHASLSSHSRVQISVSSRSRLSSKPKTCFLSLEEFRKRQLLTPGLRSGPRRPLVDRGAGRNVCQQTATAGLAGPPEGDPAARPALQPRGCASGILASGPSPKLLFVQDHFLPLLTFAEQLIPNSDSRSSGNPQPPPA